MPHASRKFGHAGRQLNLRDQLSLDPMVQLKVAMQEALKACGMSRAQVVDDMNRLAAIAGIIHEGRNGHITEAILDKWVARGAAAHQIPIRYIPIFCHVTDSTLPIEALLPPGNRIIKGEQIILLKWAAVETEHRRLGRQSRRLAQEAGIQ